MAKGPIWIDYKLQMKYNGMTLKINLSCWKDSKLQDDWWNLDNLSLIMSSITTLKCYYLYSVLFLSYIAHLTFLKLLFVEVTVAFSLVIVLEAGRKKRGGSVSKFTVLCILKRTKNLTGGLLSIWGQLRPFVLKRESYWDFKLWEVSKYYKSKHWKGFFSWLLFTFLPCYFYMRWVLQIPQNFFFHS